jgi:hypothetical protein
MKKPHAQAGIATERIPAREWVAVGTSASSKGTQSTGSNKDAKSGAAKASQTSAAKGPKDATPLKT